MTQPETEPDPLEGLSDAAGATLDRVAMRTRESDLTLSAWRLGFVTAQGEGVIFLVETPGGGTLFRGDGVCLGWPQQRLEAAYRRLLPGGSDPEPDAGQLG
jgi:hypothetical protein